MVMHSLPGDLDRDPVFRLVPLKGAREAGEGRLVVLAPASARKRVVESLPARAIVALLVAITPRYRVAVVLGAGLGLREGEAFGLLDAKVDRQGKRVRIVSQARRGELDAVLKTDASTRTIPADEWVLREVDNHVARFGLGPGGNIVTNRLGRVAQRSSFGTCWREAVASARTCLKPLRTPVPRRRRPWPRSHRRGPRGKSSGTGAELRS
ncbi:MAG: hypothetical protein JO345_08390 [Streptosporangiaceae bacterium]|nr:hypothetical protein [Streptosporangiaceae bacterium]